MVTKVKCRMCGKMIGKFGIGSHYDSKHRTQQMVEAALKKYPDLKIVGKQKLLLLQEK